MARFSDEEQSYLASSGRHRDGVRTKPSLCLPSFAVGKTLWAARDSAQRASGMMEEFEGICVKKHPHFVYSSSQTRAGLGLSMI